jgi:hypothetical protein
MELTRVLGKQSEDADCIKVTQSGCSSEALAITMKNTGVPHNARNFMPTLGSQWKWTQILPNLSTKQRYSFRVLSFPPAYPLLSCSFCLPFCFVIGVEAGAACNTSSVHKQPTYCNPFQLRVFFFPWHERKCVRDCCQNEPCSVECIKILQFVFCCLCHILFSHVSFFIFTWLLIFHGLNTWRWELEFVVEWIKPAVDMFKWRRWVLRFNNS